MLTKYINLSTVADVASVREIIKRFGWHCSQGTYCPIIMVKLPIEDLPLWEFVFAGLW